MDSDVNEELIKDSFSDDNDNDIIQNLKVSLMTNLRKLYTRDMIK